MMKDKRSMRDILWGVWKKICRVCGKAVSAVGRWLWKVSPIIMTTIYAAAMIIGGIFLVRTILNETSLINYDNGQYFAFPENVVEYMNFGENEVAPYNMGNIRYQQGRYEDAITEYATALHYVNEDTTEGRDCKIRINLALAILHTYDFDNLDLEDKDQVNEAIEILLTARSYLTENGCASEEMDTADGHSEDAEKLKHAIDELLKKLMQNGGGGGDDGDGEGGSGDENDSQNQSQNPNEQNDNSSGQSQAEKEEAERQEALEQQLNDQKVDLQNGTESYTDADGHIYNYTESNEVSGYGDAIPW